MFTHLDSGTPEHVWIAEPRLRSAPPLALDIDELVVVASHPDDEVLGAGGSIARAHAGGAAITIAMVTDGEASHPASVTHSPSDLRSRRRVEVVGAVQELAPDARVIFLALPDGGIREHTAELETALRAVLASSPTARDRILMLAPWSGDGHRDHRVTAECVSRVASELGIRHLGFPIWLWHWGRPADVPWEHASLVSLGALECAVKTRALRAHSSQLEPLSPAPGDEAIVSPAMLSHFLRDIEVFFTEAPPESDEDATLDSAFFDDFYARHDDPWGFETRWYEERKRALLLASLPVRDLGAVLEIGCATGLITAELAPRADSVLALDVSQTALGIARARVQGDPGVTVRRAAIPDEWPDGRFDTIVLSEVGYYLSRNDLRQAISRIDGALSDDGFVVACHWRHAVAEYPLTGDEVHRALRLTPGWATLALHQEEDFVLEVFGRAPLVSVAHREGLR